MTVSLRFEHVSVRSLRNVTAIDLEPASRFNVVAGENGQGKTSLLEAIYLVATSRSFRTERLRELLQESKQAGSATARIEEAGLRRDQRAILGPGGRSVQIDGNRPERLSAYAIRTPVVVFHPGDLGIVGGPASGRRTLLDRIALFIEPASADHRLRYARALRSRQAVLDHRGPAAGELDALEQLLGTHGAALTAARARAAERLVEALVPAFERMAASGPQLAARFSPGGFEDPDRLTAELARQREVDRRRKSARVGPQRDELDLQLDGRSARRHASQGQQRLITLAIKLAELECVRAARGAHPVLLLDDVSSELDPTRTGAVYDFLRQSPSQVFVTTTRPELFATPGLAPGERRDWTVRDGALEPR